MKQSRVVLDTHFPTSVSMATPASLASHQHLWSRYIGDVPGKGHWECVHFDYVFYFEKNTGNSFDLFTIQTTSEKVIGCIFPPAGLQLMFPSAKSGKTTFPSVATPKICHFSSWCTKKSGGLVTSPFCRSSCRRGLRSRRCRVSPISCPAPSPPVRWFITALPRQQCQTFPFSLKLLVPTDAVPPGVREERPAHWRDPHRGDPRALRGTGGSGEAAGPGGVWRGPWGPGPG